MSIDRDTIEKNLRLHVDRLAGLIGPRTLSKPKTIQATIGYIEGQATDTPDTLDYPSMTEVTLGVASAMRKLLK